MNDVIRSGIQDLIIEGEEIQTDEEYQIWVGKTQAFLTAAADEDIVSFFMRYTREREPNDRLRGVAYLKGILAKYKDANINDATISLELNHRTQVNSKRIFIVHGHDTELRETTARFLERLNLIPIILHEQPNSGNTIIEKFENHSDVSFAIILLTPDDVGAAKSNQSQLQKRARQNVIFEFGYFIGKLGRNKVCALYSEGVELPSDYNGVLYIKVDPDGAWKTKIAQEFVQAKIQFSLEGLI